MAFSVLQAGSTLVGVDQRGSSVTLTLPTGVTIDANKQPRFAVFGNYVILVNSPSRPLTIDGNLNVRVLTPNPPSSAPVAAGSSGAGGLTGTYEAKQTFRVYDTDGRLISESDYGPTSNAATIAAKLLNASGLSVSSDNVSASGLYRTTTGTTTFFKWAELNGNTQTSFEDDLSDAGLATLAAPILGTPPDLYLIAEFRSRLFGVGKNSKDYLNFTEIGFQYAWPSDNQEPIARIGSDARGITALVRKRDALGIGRSNGLYQFTGTDDTNFRVVNISENCGVEATDSVAVYRDTAFFLWKDGVYKWDSSGKVTCVSDGRIRRWFTDNGTFNLSRLQYAFAHIDPFKFIYRLFLASADSNVENCWIDYDFVNDKWWGPHTSHAFNPAGAFQFSTSSGLFIPVIGGTDGFLRRERRRRFDDEATAIDFDVVTARIDEDAPNDTKYFGELSVLNQPEESGTLRIQTTVGTLDEQRRRWNPTLPPDKTLQYEHDLRDDREVVGRIGVGEACKVRFRNNEADVNVGLRGFEIDPITYVGTR
jgi:hypothetical protein